MSESSKLEAQQSAEPLTFTMNDLLQFDREEIQFLHDDEDFIYSFHQFDSGKITFKRLWPAAPANEAEAIIYPGGQKDWTDAAIIVMYKAAASGQPLKGFLPNVLRTMLDMYISRKALEERLDKAVSSFRVKSPIAELKKVLDFVEPYAPWMKVDGDKNRSAMAISSPASEKPATQPTPSQSPPGSANTKTPETKKLTNPGTPVSLKPDLPATKFAPPSSTPTKAPPTRVRPSELSDVLNQPASKKRTLESEDGPSSAGTAEPQSKKPFTPPATPRPSTSNSSSSTTLPVSLRSPAPLKPTSESKESNPSKLNDPTSVSNVAKSPSPPQTPVPFSKTALPSVFNVMKQYIESLKPVQTARPKAQTAPPTPKVHISLSKPNAGGVTKPSTSTIQPKLSRLLKLHIRKSILRELMAGKLVEEILQECENASKESVDSSQKTARKEEEKRLPQEPVCDYCSKNNYECSGGDNCNRCERARIKCVYSTKSAGSGASKVTNGQQEVPSLKSNATTSQSPMKSPYVLVRTNEKEISPNNGSLSKGGNPPRSAMQQALPPPKPSRTAIQYPETFPYTLLSRNEIQAFGNSSSKSANPSQATKSAAPLSPATRGPSAPASGQRPIPANPVTSTTEKPATMPLPGTSPVTSVSSRSSSTKPNINPMKDVVTHSLEPVPTPDPTAVPSTSAQTKSALSHPVPKPSQATPASVNTINATCSSSGIGTFSRPNDANKSDGAEQNAACANFHKDENQRSNEPSSVRKDTLPSAPPGLQPPTEWPKPAAPAFTVSSPELQGTLNEPSTEGNSSHSTNKEAALVNASPSKAVRQTIIVNLDPKLKVTPSVRAERQPTPPTKSTPSVSAKGVSPTSQRSTPPNPNDVMVSSPVASNLSSPPSQYEEVYGHVPLIAPTGSLPPRTSLTRVATAKDFLARELAIREENERKSQLRLHTYITTIDEENKVMKRLLEAEYQKTADLDAQSLKVASELKTLEINNADLQDRYKKEQAEHEKAKDLLRREQKKVQEMEFARGVSNARIAQTETLQKEAEQKAARAEQALEANQRTREQELEQAKKRGADEVRKEYEEIVTKLTGENEKLRAKIKTREILCEALKQFSREQEGVINQS